MEDFKLYKWQEETIERAKTEPNLALFATMGTGKSCCTIQIIRNLCKQAERLKKILILGPVAVVYNWKNEIEKFSNIPIKQVFVSTGNGETRSKKLEDFLKNNEYGVVVTNYESLRNKTLFHSLKLWGPEVLIADESHLVKSYESQQSKLTFELSASATNRYILSGTPILNSPMDLYMQYKILDQGKTFGANFFRFRAEFFVNENATKPWLTFPSWVPNPHKFEELNRKMMSIAVRVRREECLDLPDRIEQVYYVEMSKEQSRIYKEMKKDFITYIQDNKGKDQAVVAQLAITKAIRLQQIVTGFCLTDSGEIIEVKDVPRLQAVKDLLGQILPENKCILWCSYIHNYRQLERLCDSMSIKYSSITGEQNAEEKQKAVDSFQKDPDTKIVICNRKAAGLGITLTAAAYSIIYSRNFSLAEEAQSADRNYRAGSEQHEKIVKIDLCSKGTIDELVLTALKNKQKISDIILDRYKEV